MISEFTPLYMEKYESLSMYYACQILHNVDMGEIKFCEHMFGVHMMNNVKKC